jgi:hypothetical protein
LPNVCFFKTKDVATRYERALQESEVATEKCKNRLDFTSEELERLLLQKEGESFKDSTFKSPTAVGGGGKRAIGKAVAKGGLLLKGKNPGNVRNPFLSLSHFIEPVADPAAGGRHQTTSLCCFRPIPKVGHRNPDDAARILQFAAATNIARR